MQAVIILFAASVNASKNCKPIHPLLSRTLQPPVLLSTALVSMVGKGFISQIGEAFCDVLGFYNQTGHVLLCILQIITQALEEKRGG